MSQLTYLLPRFSLADYGAKHPQAQATQYWLKKAKAMVPASTKISNEFGVAALSALADGLAAEQGYWLRCDPVNFYVDKDAVFLLEETVSELSLEEAEQLVAELNQFLQQDQLKLQIGHPNRWYLQLRESPDISTQPLTHIVGKNLLGCLPQGAKQQYWRTLLTEIQILLQQSSVNKARRQRGQMEINSVWFWGGGKLPQAGIASEGLVVGDSDADIVKWEKIWSDDIITKGLALLNGESFEVLPAKFNVESVEPNNRKYYLINIQAWQSVDIEKNWLAPILQALQTQQLTQVIIHDKTTRYELTSNQVRPWWKHIFG